MKLDGDMGEPLRNERPLTVAVYPESPGLLPEHATDKPLGEWPADSQRVLSGVRVYDESGRGKFGAVKRKMKPVATFVQDRASGLRRRFEVIRGQVKSGELRDTATTRARDARNRAEYYARNNPLQFIAGCAAAGFAIGFLLRMWRREHR